MMMKRRRQLMMEKGQQTFLEPKSYYAQKDQLLAKIDSSIRELKQLQQNGSKERIIAVTNLLEARLRELAVFRQAAGVTLAVGRRTMREG